MKIAVIGLGYIGLPNAVMFATKGIDVLGVDINQNVVDAVNQGRVHIIEPDLEELVRSVVLSGSLKANTKLAESDAYLIAVPTPLKKDRTPDLQYIEAAVRSVAPFLKRGDIVILESTLPVGATAQIVKWLSEMRLDLRFPSSSDACDVHIAYCPERVLPGKIVRELVENDRIIGGVTAACANRAKDIYRLFVQGDLVITSAATAEMCKLTENAFRDVNIAFANELSLICDELGLDVWELIRMANRHPRVNILRPGSGVGGHCIAVDPWFVVARNPERARLIRAAREVNDYKSDWIVDKVREARIKLAERLQRPPCSIRLACYGLAFKPDIADLRESPALSIAERLSSDCKDKLLVVEPHIAELPRSLTNAGLVNLDRATDQADLNIVLIAHSIFRNSVQLRAARKLDFTGIFSDETFDVGG